MVDTVEVRSSSLLVPTISFNGLALLTLLREAPNGSIKPTAPRREDIPFYTSHMPTSRKSESALNLFSLGPKCRRQFINSNKLVGNTKTLQCLNLFSYFFSGKVI
jgi:hypothetical protein